MMKRRFALPLALAAILLLAVPLAGCGRGAAPTVPPASTSAAVTEAPPTPTPTPEPTLEPTPTPRPIVTVRGMLPGKAPADMDVVLTGLNGKLVNELAVNLELMWSSADKYDKNVEAAAASDTRPDFIWCSSSKLASYAGKGFIAPLDDVLAAYGADITKNIDARLFDTMKINGKLMGLPSSGNMPLKGGGQAFIYREDLREKYGLPKPDSIAAMEQYFKAVAQNEPGMTPLSHKSAALVALWASASADFLAGTNNAVLYSVDEGGAVACAALQASEAFKQSVQKSREWYKAGWLMKAVLSFKDPQGEVTASRAAATAGDVGGVSAMQEALAAKEAGATLAAVPLSGCGAGFITGNGGNAICLVSGSPAPDRTMELLNWIYASQENHDFVSYGLVDRNYSLSGDRILLQGDGYAAFPGRIFANLNYLRFPVEAPEALIGAVKGWNDGAEVSPLFGFTLDPAPVKNELAKARTVYANYSPQLLSGSSDAAALLAEFNTKMAAAGQDKIVAEAQNQVNAYIAAK